MMLFGDRIKSIRLSEGLTQPEFAKMFNITTRQYQRYESNEQFPTVTKLLEIVNHFDISMDYLFGRTNNPKVSK